MASRCAAFLAVDHPCSDFRDLGQAAWLLRHAGHDVILTAAYGEVPPGMRGALARTEAAVQPRRYYSYLRALLSASDGSLRRMIERLSIISLAKLRAARALPADARRPGLVDRIVSLRDARDLKSFIDLISAHGADRAAMITAFETHKRQLREVARHWSLKASFPPHPIPGCATYLPINSGQELRDVAHQFRNCVRVYIADVLDNLCAFGIFELEGHDRAVVHLQRDLGGRWSLQGLHGTSNLAVSRELRGRAEAYLEQHGILIRRRSHAASKYDPVRRLSRYYSFADDDD